MKKIFSCRRSSLALIGMLLLATIGYYKGLDISSAVAAICVAVAGANSYEKKNGA